MSGFPERMLRAVADDPSRTTEEDSPTNRVADAALRQFELFGLARSTMDDIARRANVSRVTVYRRFPGKAALVDAVGMRELQRFLSDLDEALAEVEAPEDRIVEGFVFTLHAMRTHRLLQRLLESEPESIVPHLTVDGAPFIAAASDYLAQRGLQEVSGRDPEEFRVVSEIVVRLILSCLLTPQSIVDLDEPAEARAFARRYLRPLLLEDQA